MDALQRHAGDGREPEFRTALLTLRGGDAEQRERMVDYEEYYEIDRAAFERYRTDPGAASGFLERCRNREADELLFLKPGRDRGVPA